MYSFYGKNFYHPSVCHFCKTTRNLKLCGRCKSLSYCCKEHQTLDWANHKDFCKVILDIDKILTVDVENLEEVNILMRPIEKICQAKLKRSLYAYEEQILLYHRRCLVCHSRDALISCGTCLSVFYCSEKHKKIKAKKHACASMKLNFDLLLFKYKTSSQVIPSFRKRRMKLEKLPKNLEKLMVFLTKSYIRFPRNIHDLECRMMTDSFAPVANVLFGLEKSALLKNHLLMKTNLVVHIVGADIEERSWNWCMLLEFAFHWIKNLKQLTYIAIGPEAKSWNFTLMNMLSVCGFCNMSTSNIKCFSSPNYYHNILNELEKPDIVVAFNCGLFNTPSWIKSIPCLIKYANVPLVLTDYSLINLEKDCEIIVNHTSRNIQVILKPQRNPFSYICPERNDLKNNPIHFRNGYITILKSL